MKRSIENWIREIKILVTNKRFTNNVKLYTNFKLKINNITNKQKKKKESENKSGCFMWRKKMMMVFVVL